MAKCPILEEIYAYRMGIRQAYNNRRFDELEAKVAEAREKKEVFGNGSWKSFQFYASFECRDDEPESMWKLHDRIHQDWLKAKPQSIAAHVSYADFLVEYAWHARGTGFASTVTEEGWKLFRERLAEADRILQQGKTLEEKDPQWARVALIVGRGQGADAEDLDKLADEASAIEPTFWGYHTERATSLLPRWYGKPGDWERYAEKVAARPEGLGDEVYARIVISVAGYHENVFKQTNASWPKTREGLKKLRAKYPKSLELLGYCAKFGALAGDRDFSKEAFAEIGTKYLPSSWRKPELFWQFKNWAEASPR